MPPAITIAPTTTPMVMPVLLLVLPEVDGIFEGLSVPSEVTVGGPIAPVDWWPPRSDEEVLVLAVVVRTGLEVDVEVEVSG